MEKQLKSDIEYNQKDYEKKNKKPKPIDQLKSSFRYQEMDKYRDNCQNIYIQY